MHSVFDWIASAKHNVYAEHKYEHEYHKNEHDIGKKHVHALFVVRIGFGFDCERTIEAVQVDFANWKVSIAVVVCVYALAGLARIQMNSLREHGIVKAQFFLRRVNAKVCVVIVQFLDKIDCVFIQMSCI